MLQIHCSPLVPALCVWLGFVKVTPGGVRIVDIFIIELDPEGGVIDSEVARGNGDAAVEYQRGNF